MMRFNIQAASGRFCIVVRPSVPGIQVTVSHGASIPIIVQGKPVGPNSFNPPGILLDDSNLQLQLDRQMSRIESRVLASTLGMVCSGLKRGSVQNTNNFSFYFYYLQPGRTRSFQKSIFSWLSFISYVSGLS
jgi:hypothetical protein